MSGFLGGTRSARPHCTAIRMPAHVMTNEGWTKGRWPYGDGGFVKPRPVCGRAEPAPPRGCWPNEDCLRGKGQGNAMSGFLGGTRSARPQRRAGCKPRHGLADPEDRVLPRARGARHGCLTGIACWWNPFPFAGVRSPPLRGDVRRAKIA